jgi:dolichol-phosphate mannosyltransferase
MSDASHNVLDIRARKESTTSGPLISIIIPTFNERNNIARVVDALAKALNAIRWEVIFVDDDSPDGTVGLVREIGRQQPHVRCIHRVGRRGLSAACIEGMLSSSAPYLAVMDGDLQHDPAVVRRMLAILEAGETELVIGSRYMEGGGFGEWSNDRRRISGLATRLSRIVLTDEIKDPMSNFFALRRELLDEVVRGLSGLSFKILLDILLTARRVVRFREVPYVLGTRTAGESKFELIVAWEYMMLLADKTIGRFIPARFISFATLGAAAAAVHFLTLAVAFRVVALDFVRSEILATLVSMLCNYWLNNLLTYNDVRRRGISWFTGLLSFTVVCSAGVLVNICLATFLYARGTNWIPAAIAGVLIASIWNYAATSAYTWGGERVRNREVPLDAAK